MASSRPWPFDEDERPSGSVRPLSQADLQAILAHLSDDPEELLAGTGADRPVVAVRVRASVGRPGGSAQARWRRLRGPSGLPGPEPCPGGSPSSWGLVSVEEYLAATWLPGWNWSLPCWPLRQSGGGCGFGPARTRSSGGGGRPGSDAPPGCSARFSGRGGRFCMTWPSPPARSILIAMIPSAVVAVRSDPNIDRPGAFRVDLSTDTAAAAWRRPAGRT
jgi:hypothetical protein